MKSRQQRNNDSSKTQEGNKGRDDTDVVRSSSDQEQFQTMERQYKRIENAPDDRESAEFRPADTATMHSRHDTIQITKPPFSVNNSEVISPQLMGQASSCHILLVSNSNTETHQHLEGLRDSEDKTEATPHNKLGGIVAPPSVFINKNSGKNLLIQQHANDSGHQSQLERERGLPTETFDPAYAVSKELDGLMSVVDHQSETESKMTTGTNQTPYGRILEPVLAQRASEYQQKPPILPIQKAKGGIHVRQFKGKTLLQKTQFLGQEKKSWQIDFNTGQITVMNTTAVAQDNKLHSIGSQPSSSVVDSKNKTIETPMHADHLHGQKYSHLPGSVQKTTLLDSQRQLESQRWGNAAKNDYSKHPSTLQKNSLNSAGFYQNTIQQHQMADSPKQVNFTQRTMRTRQALAAAKNQMMECRQETGNDFQNYMTSQEQVSQNNASGFRPSSRPHNSDGTTNQGALVNRRYVGGHKRIQSANPASHTQRFKNRNRQTYQSGLGSILQENASQHQPLHQSNRLGGAIQSSNFTGISHQQDYDRRALQSMQRRTIDQHNQQYLQSCSGQVQFLEGRNFTVDFDSPPESITSSRRNRNPNGSSSRQMLNRAKIQSATTNMMPHQGGLRPGSVRPMSGSCVNRASRISGKSPPNDGGKKTIVTVDTNTHLNAAQQSYHQHKMAQQLLAEEEQMARQQELIMAQSQILLQSMGLLQKDKTVSLQGEDPEALLKRDGKKGTTTSMAESEIMDKLFKNQKYDSKQNILLAKNPLIIRKETFGNQIEFNMETAKAIIEILAKKSTSDQLASNINQTAADQLKFFEQQEQQNLSLLNTNVGDIELQKDQANHALFNFLGSLKSYQQLKNQQIFNSSPSPPQKEKSGKMLSQGYITQRINDGNRKRRSRLWSAAGAGARASSGNTTRVNNSRTVTVASSQGNKKKQNRYSGKNSCNSNNMATGASIQYASNAESMNNMMQERYYHHGATLKPQESSSVMIYEGLQNMQQIFNQKRGDSRQSTIAGAPYELDNNRNAMGVQQNTDQMQMNASMEIEREPDTNQKTEVRQSLEPLQQASQVHVQSIQIALQQKANKTRQSNHDSSPSDDKANNDQQQTQQTEGSQIDVAGVVTLDGTRQKLEQVAAVDDYKQAAGPANAADKSKQASKQSHQSQAAAANTNRSLGSSQKMAAGHFKMQRKRCQSAHPLSISMNNKKQPSVKRLQNLLSSDSSSQNILQVQGKNISNKNLSVKPSLEATLSRKMIKSSASNDVSKLSSEKVFIAAIAKENAAEDQENRLGTLVAAAQNSAALNIEQNAVGSQNNVSQPDPRSPVSNTEDPTPFGYRTEYLTFNQAIATVSNQQQAVDQDYTHLQEPQTALKDGEQSSIDKLENTPAKQNFLISPIKPIEEVGQSPEPQGDYSDRTPHNKVKANTDLVLSKESENSQGATGNNRIDVATLQMVEPILQSGETEGILLAIPASNASNYKESGYQSTLTANTRTISNVGKKGSKSIMLTSNNRAKDKTPQICDGDHCQQLESAKTTMLLSSYQREPAEVDRQFSANSTVKIDLNSHGGGEVIANINAIGTDVYGHKIIAPESQMGQVYQKTNLAIHQRGLRQLSKQQKVMGMGSPREGKFSSGVTMTDFNSKLNFDRDGGKQGKNHPANRTSRDMQQHRQRMRNTRPRLQTQNYQLANDHRNSGRMMENASSSGGGGVCEDCNGLRNSVDNQPKLNAMGGCNRQPSTTHFVISTIENINAVNSQIAQANQQQQKEQFLASVTQQQQKQGGAGGPIFSPSEHQFVIEQLQELPVELHQQLSLQSTNQKSSVRVSQDFCPDSNQQILIFKDQTIQEGQQPEPIQIIGHKNIHQRKKGLSLVSYPKSFLVGKRNMTKTVRSSSNTTNAETNKTKKIVSKATKQRRLANMMNLVPGGRSLLSPPLLVVNSQTMIMTKRKIQEAASSHGKHPSSAKGSTSQIRIGIQPSERILNGIQVQGGSDLPADLNYQDTQQCQCVNLPQNQAAICDPRFNIVHLNECSHLAIEDVKDIDSSQGNIILQSAQQPADYRALSTEKQSLEITMKNSVGAASRPACSPSMGKKGSKAVAQKKGQINIQHVNYKDCQADQDEVGSQNNRSTQRRNIMSRQSSPMSKVNKMTPHNQGDENVNSQAASNINVVNCSGSDKTVGAWRQQRNSEHLLTSPGGNQGKQATLTARGDINKSLSSNQINALDADSAKDYASQQQLQRVPVVTQNNMTMQLKVHKINSDSTIKNNLSQKNDEQL